ncbi:MAG: ABC transporter substrate-binding protein [Alphaproteobacteria bacterium]|nr:ABC transporter substrate-binding protein [Alphaproteobacteria bacterium]
MRRIIGLIVSLLRELRLASGGSVAVLASALIAASGPAGAETIFVQDSRGNTIQIERPVASVAIFPLPIPEAMIALDGGTQRMTAINPRAKVTLMNGVMGELFPEIADISTDLVAGNFVPNVEEILRVNPHVVLQWQTNAGVRVAPMENAGVTVATVSTADRETRRGYITMMGAILGKEARAQSFLDWDDAVIAEIDEKLKSAPYVPKPRVAFIDSLDGNEFILFGQQELYFDAGGLSNAATEAGHTDGSVKVGAESILTWDPDIILVNYYNDAITPEDILAHPVLAALDAVKSGRVYKTPAIDPATAAGGELVYLWFAKIGYPDLFDTDLRQATLDGFQFLYGKQLTPAQIDRLLNMAWNKDSAGYMEWFGQSQ